MCAHCSHSHHRPDECPKPALAQCTLVMSGIVPCTAQKLPRTRSHRCGMMHPDRHARASPIRAQMVRHAANLDKVFAVADKAGSKLTQQIFEAHKGDAEITFKAAQRRYKAHCVEAEARSNAAAHLTSMANPKAGIPSASCSCNAVAASAALPPPAAADAVDADIAIATARGQTARCSVLRRYTPCGVRPRSTDPPGAPSTGGGGTWSPAARPPSSPSEPPDGTRMPRDRWIYYIMYARACACAC